MNKNIDNLFINIIKTLKTKIYLFFFLIFILFCINLIYIFFSSQQNNEKFIFKYVAYDMYSNLNNKLSHFLFINNQLSETLNTRTSICSKGINFSSEDSIQSTLVQKILDSKFRCSSSEFGDNATKKISLTTKYEKVINNEIQKTSVYFPKKVESKIYDNGDIRILITHKCPEFLLCFDVHFSDQNIGIEEAKDISAKIIRKETDEMYNLITDRVYDIFALDNEIQIAEIQDEISDLQSYYDSTFDFYINSLESALNLNANNEEINYDKINYNLSFLKEQKTHLNKNSFIKYLNNSISSHSKNYSKLNNNFLKQPFDYEYNVSLYRMKLSNYAMIFDFNLIFLNMIVIFFILFIVTYFSLATSSKDEK